MNDGRRQLIALFAFSALLWAIVVLGAIHFHREARRALRPTVEEENPQPRMPRFRAKDFTCLL